MFLLVDVFDHRDEVLRLAIRRTHDGIRQPDPVHLSAFTHISFFDLVGVQLAGQHLLQLRDADFRILRVAQVGST